MATAQESTAKHQPRFRFRLLSGISDRTLQPLLVKLFPTVAVVAEFRSYRDNGIYDASCKGRGDETPLPACYSIIPERRSKCAYAGQRAVFGLNFP